MSEDAKSAVTFDFEDWMRAGEAKTARCSAERLQPIFDLVERLARPTTELGEDGTWVLRITADRTEAGQQAAIAAAVQVFDGYLDEFKRYGYADTVALRTVRRHTGEYLSAQPWEKWDR